jgi:hypothetical protein
VKIRVEQVPVDTLQRHPSSAAFPDDPKDLLG